ncbi:Odorant receptor 44 [Operophtera brumata]|uniref:Odorant receptor 44 n=1 Tax=Operophtera brumata TaxID=104452 RepID=A0A0L7LRL6_OPEBR|nr:Odorant receptor 44 [Operophtera brumata]
MIENFKENVSFLSLILPYGVIEPWDDLNPKLYHAVHIYWLKFYGMWYNNFSPKTIQFWLQTIYSLLYLFLSEMYTYVKVVVFWVNKNKVLGLLEYLHCAEFKPKEKEHKEIIRNSIKSARFWELLYHLRKIWRFYQQMLSIHELMRKRAIEDSKYFGEHSQKYFTQAVLRDCIKHHNTIIRYVSMIESAFSLASALQFMLSVMIENPTSHPMQIVWMAIYLTCMLIEVFILCWFGDELIWKVGPWVNLDRKTCMYLIVFLERCKRPLQNKLE